MKKRHGFYVVSMILSTVLFLFFLQTVFSYMFITNEKIETKYAVEQLTLMGKSIRDYTERNRKQILSQFSRAEGAEKAVWQPKTSFLNSYVIDYLPKTYSAFTKATNIWNDGYKILFVRQKNPIEEHDDLLSAYVIATGGSRKHHAAGTDAGDKWLEFGMRDAVIRAGPSVGYIEKKNDEYRLKNTYFTVTDGLNAEKAIAEEGDLGYLVTTNLDDTKTSDVLLRKRTGEDEDNTMHADIDMNDNNLLNVRYLDAKLIDSANMRVNPTLYRSMEEAEDSCRNGWIYITDKENAFTDGRTDEGTRLLVTNNGKVYGPGNYNSTTHTPTGESLGMFAMNNANARSIETLGRLYYIAPVEAEIPEESAESLAVTDAKPRSATRDTFIGKHRLAVCRMINNQRTLAYLGDNRAEDKIAFVVSATDGDFIPPFFCPGQDSDVVGGGTVSKKWSAVGDARWLSSTGSWVKKDDRTNGFLAEGNNASDTTNSSGIMPRLFVVPQFVSTGPVAFPIHGIRAWAELANGTNSSGGWIIRMNALVDLQDGRVDERSYWIGNYPDSKAASADTTGYMTAQKLHEKTKGLTNIASSYIHYLKAVVIGVCSNKLQTF